VNSLELPQGIPADPDNYQHIPDKQSRFTPMTSSNFSTPAQPCPRPLALPKIDPTTNPLISSALAASITPLDSATSAHMTGGYRYASRYRPRAHYATQYHYTYYRIANPAYLLG
jgi:hypothetical protein